MLDADVEVHEVQPESNGRGGSGARRNRSANYRIEHPSALDVLRDLRIPSTDPGPGDHIPTFDLDTVDGGRFASDEFDGHGCPVLLVFGSLTCPITESAGDGLVELHRIYGDSVRFVVVNVREAHPGEHASQPATIGAKTRHATRLREHHGMDFEVAVDDVDGTVHRAFGTRPSSAYLIDPAGTIVFRAHWSNLTDELDAALAAVTNGRAMAKPAVGGTLRAMAKMTGHASSAFQSAGPGAMADTWRAAPPFAAMIAISRLFRFLPRDRRGVPTMLTAAAAMITMAVVAAAILAVW
jgi:hypothetical protein